MFTTHPVYGLIKTLVLFVTGRVQFFREDVGAKLVMGDGKVFSVFRRVRIKHFFNHDKRPEAIFIIRFKPADMSVEENKRFSRLPMMVFMGFKGFRSKYWCVEEATGLCQGIYEWDTMKDARNYSKSIAVKFMTKRSEKDSIQFNILPNLEENRAWDVVKEESMK